MNPVILRTAATFMLPLLILFSVFLLFQGHNEPGGGFVGGLMAAAAVALYAIAFDVPEARRLLRVDPQLLVAWGVLLAAGSGVPALIAGEPLLTGQWFNREIPVFGEVHLGTPLVFDAGVYLAVAGVALLIVLTMMEE
ncbi:MAG TPA: Na+/H+ antiporter subunit B [Planctomycetaceae bacterium]|nr:Na+/H+ antiporter subunit B [Planctomycetaceae bacterium]